MRSKSPWMMRNGSLRGSLACRPVKSNRPICEGGEYTFRGSASHAGRRAPNVQFFLLRKWVVAAGRDGESVARVAQLGAERAGEEDVCDAEGQRRRAVGVLGDYFRWEG